MKVPKLITECIQCGGDIVGDARREYCSPRCKYLYKRSLIPHQNNVCSICERNETRLRYGIPERLVNNEYCRECWQGVLNAKYLLNREKWLDAYWECATALMKMV